MTIAVQIIVVVFSLLFIVVVGYLCFCLVAHVVAFVLGLAYGLLVEVPTNVVKYFSNRRKATRKADKIPP